MTMGVLFRYQDIAVVDDGTEWIKLNVPAGVFVLCHRGDVGAVLKTMRDSLEQIVGGRK